MRNETIKSSIQVKAPLDVVFYTFFQFDLLTIFKKLLYIPHFSYTTPPDLNPRPGYEHTIYFEDWNTAERKLLHFIPELLFSAQIGHFTSRRFIWLSQIEYRFYFFDRVEHDRREIRCEYQFLFKSTIAAVLFKILVRKSLNNQIDTVLKKIADQLNSSI